MSVKLLERAAKSPAAKQLVAVRHDTPLKPVDSAPAGLGMATVDHFVPFHFSTNALKSGEEPIVPTATQLDALTHDTSFSASPTFEPVAGSVASVHFFPFHRSANGRSGEAPTAKQLFVPTQDTLARAERLP
jgi:hypothetical protein